MNGKTKRIIENTYKTGYHDALAMFCDELPDPRNVAAEIAEGLQAHLAFLKKGQDTDEDK